jgi:hypothetical protein
MDLCEDLQSPYRHLAPRPRGYDGKNRPQRCAYVLHFRTKRWIPAHQRKPWPDKQFAQYEAGSNGYYGSYDSQTMWRVFFRLTTSTLLGPDIMCFV